MDDKVETAELLSAADAQTPPSGDSERHGPDRSGTAAETPRSLTSTDKDSKTPTTRGRFGELVRKARWRAHWLIPFLVRPPNDKADRDFRMRRDREVNERTRVPDGEQLRVTAVWGVELFGPSEVDRLCEGLERLAWSNGGGDAVTWVRDQRAFGSEGSWYEVGYVVPRGQTRRLALVENRAQLPEDVDHLLVRIFQLTATMTCVLIGFALKDSLARCYELELNRDRRTATRRGKRRWWMSHLDPHHLKTESVDDARSRLRSLASEWFAANLPGYFCSRSASAVLTAEFVTTSINHLLPDDTDDSPVHFEHWRRVIVNVPHLDVWRLAECEGLRVSELGRRLTTEPLHLIVSLRTRDIPSKSLEFHGGPSAAAHLRYCHERVDGVLINLAGVSFLKIASKELKASREALRLGRSSGRSTLQILEKIHNFFDRSMAVPAVANELLHRSKRAALYQHECADFRAPAWPKSEESRVLAKQLREQTKLLATRVVAEEHALREHLEQLSSILSVRESVKAQQRMEWLTAAALAVALLSLVVAVSSLWAALPR